MQNVCHLTETQLSIFADVAKDEKNTAYNIVRGYAFPRDRVDRDRFIAALGKVFQAHPVFRTVLVRDGKGVPCQKITDRTTEIRFRKAKDGEFDPLAYQALPFSPLFESPLSRAEVIETETKLYYYLDISHIIYDAPSEAILLRELERAYNDGEAPEAESVTVFDTALKEDSPSWKEAKEVGSAWYRKLITNTDISTEIEGDVLAEELRTLPPAVGHAELVFTAEETAAIRAFASAEGSMTSALHYLAFGCTLAAFLNQDEALFSTIINSRTKEEARTMGMYAAAYPVYFERKDDMTVSEALKNMNAEIRESRTHLACSLASFCADTGMKPSVMLVYQGDFHFTLHLGDGLYPALKLSPTKDCIGDFTVEISLTEGVFRADAQYRTNRCTKDLANAVLETYRMVLLGIVNGRELNRIDLLSEKQLEVADRARGDDIPHDTKSTVVDLFRRRAKETPDADAVVYLDRKLTFKELDDLTDRLAANIESRGIGKEDVVAILIPRCEYMAICALGVLKSGAAYQPLDPSYPSERLQFMVTDASARLLIADRSLTDLLPDYGGPVLCTDEIQGLPEGKPTHAPSPEDLFILLYTSGTTGIPKGVCLVHGNLMSYCAYYRRSRGLTPGCRVSAYASFGFDACMMDLYPALTAGGCVHIIDEAIRLNLNELNDYLEKNRIDHAFMTTQVGRQFALFMRNSSLKSLGVGGEKLAPMEPPEDFDLINLYGPTECTVNVTETRVDRLYSRVPIGKALDRIRLYVVDKYGRRCPAYMPGELLISGPQVARGYLNRPEKTEEVFKENPFSRDPGYERVYYTGDIVRLLNDGSVDIIGRRDSQVKIRGFRIELTEVENIIREYPGIDNVVVRAFEDENGGGKWLCAYLVSKNTVDPAALGTFIREHKPPYMVPSVILQIDSIPLNQNQKVDFRKLPVPERKIAKSDAPRKETALEARLREIVADVVGNNEFDVETPLGDAGLTSITAMRLAFELEKVYGFEADLRTLAADDSILSLENQIVEGLLTARSPLEQMPAEEKAISADSRIPLTQSQLGIWLECQMTPDSDRYQIPFALKLSRAADPGKLAEAIKAAVNNHPSLFCTVESDREYDAVMVAHTPKDVLVERKVMSSEEALQEIRGGKIRIDLEKGPLFHFTLYETPEALYLLMLFHHVTMDGTSIAVFLEDVETAYQGGDLQPETDTIFDLALEERKLRATDALTKAKAVYDAFFLNRSADSAPAPDVKSKGEGKAGSCSQRLSHVDGAALKAFTDRYHVTENAVFTAALAYLLARTANEETAIFANIYNGRTGMNTARTLGMLVKTYPVFAEINGEQKTGDFVVDIRKETGRLTANDIYSFAEASRAYGVNADVLFACQGDNFNSFTLAGEPAEKVDIPFEGIKAPLSVDVLKEDGEYVVSIEYDDSRYSAARMKWFADAYDMACAGVIRDIALKDITLFSENAAALVDRANDTDWPTEYVPVCTFLERSAGKYPDRLAVAAVDGELTYRELNEKANRTAHGLLALGEVEAGEKIALMLRRTSSVYVTRQAILKAGGAFLSVDPEYPEDRIRFMLTDAGVKKLIVSEDVMKEREAFLKGLPLAVLTVEALTKTKESGNPGIYRAPDDPAYCIYTSGSTGRPKGVLLTQRNLVNFLDANEKNPEILGYTERARVSLAQAAITFDVSIMEEFIPLAHGMTIVMADEEAIHDPVRLAALMERCQVDMMTCTPSFLMNMIDMKVMRKALAGVRSYDFGAEAFQSVLFGKIRELNPTAYIMNGYGPTETTISCIVSEVTDPEDIRIGRPASNVRAFILDENGMELPPYVPGELVIGGDGVGSGYIGLPEKTAAAFITHRGCRAYKSGDICAFDGDGEIRYIGRRDGQVKLRGLRVELGEIESAVSSFEGIKNCVVKALGEDIHMYLAAYFTAERKIDVAALREALSGTLTPYMVPEVYMQLDEMPLTANGKIDKKNLPEPERSACTERAVKPPRNDTEARFCQLFSEILGVSEVSADDDFFALGGTSLSASRVAVFASENDMPIVYADVFRCRTPEALAALITVGREQQGAAEDDDISRYDYGRIDALLQKNTLDNLVLRPDRGAGILLTGAPGFLAVNVLKKYLEQYEGTAWVLARRHGTLSPENRLKSILVYYYSDNFEWAFESGRLRCIEGDITDAESLKQAESLDWNVLINCAASVKHFVSDDSLDRINFHGVENLITLCERTGRRLCQISTVSVAGESVNGDPNPERKLKETDLYIGQALDNAYIRSKFLAERAVLAAVADGRLDGCICRMGNLCAQHDNGEFQINFNTNAFMRNLTAYRALEAYPLSLMNTPVEFSEIDKCGEAVLDIAIGTAGCTVFHPVNNHLLTYADVIWVMREYGFPIDIVDNGTFDERLKDAMKDPDKAETVASLLSYNASEEAGRRVYLDVDTSFTTTALYSLGFKWPVSSEQYLHLMIRNLDELGMFEQE